MKNIRSTRRRFLKKALGTFCVLATALPLSKLFAKAKPGVPLGQPLLSENDEVAKSLGYHKDATKVDPKRFPKRADAAGKSQFCHNCAFYSAIAQTKEWGKCSVLPTGLVAANGWCNTWAPKP